VTTEIQAKTTKGAPVLIGGLLLLFGLIAAFVWCAIRADRAHGGGLWVALLVIIGIAAFVNLFMLRGLSVIAPNSALVTVVFGTYTGTIKTPGFWYVNPLAKKAYVSLRTRNMVTPTIKVNDVRGNPIEIGAVVVWRVTDTAKALFDVESFKGFVDTQCESSLRHLASVYPYDTGIEHETSLRGATDEVSRSLAAELQERVAKSGVTIEESRLSHLAYAPEIAGAMLRRQQADAVVSARFRIVEGAVGMVEAALDHLEKGGKVSLDDERRAAMVSNLMVVLCGDHGVQPVVNTGTLYQG